MDPLLIVASQVNKDEMQFSVLNFKFLIYIVADFK